MDTPKPIQSEQKIKKTLCADNPRVENWVSFQDDYWDTYRKNLNNALSLLIVTDSSGLIIESNSAIATLSSWSSTVEKMRGTQFFIGNGASAGMASHFALDWSKNGSLRSLAFNDIAFLTAIGNDIGYDQVFAEPIRYFGCHRDLIASISSSGNSSNILCALDAAKSRKMRIVTFSGMGSNNASRALGDMNFYVPAQSYGIVESAHQVLLHAWLDHFIGTYKTFSKL
jgi:D-sedoheptulose 7-phosphate isomerase